MKKYRHLVFPETTITDPFGMRRHWITRKGTLITWSLVHAGIDYRFKDDEMPPLRAPCNCRAYGEILVGGGRRKSDDSQILIIPDKVEHTMFYVRHRDPYLVSIDRHGQYRIKNAIKTWVSYKKGDIMVDSPKTWGNYVPHTHFEVNCTPAAPIFQRALGDKRFSPALYEALEKKLEGYPQEMIDKARRKMEKQISIWGIDDIHDLYIITKKWPQERLCKASEVGKWDKTIRIDPQFALKCGI